MKFLLIRFSSIGDVTQSLSLPAHIKSKFPEAEIHFLTKDIFAPLLNNNPYVTKVWTINKSSQLIDLIQFIKTLRNENYDYLYDAHNNLRSNIFYIFIQARNKLQKPMFRFKRFMLLKFKKNLFELPFSGQRDILKPLETWGIPFRLPDGPQLFLNNDVIQKAENLILKNNIQFPFIAIAPSAAHYFKRWPIESWKKLFTIAPHLNFVVLAGPEDAFTQEFNNFKNVINLTGQTTLIESAALIQFAEKVISNDTGLLHFAEQLTKKTVALMGAAPFGFPSKKTTLIIKKDLPCWPCSKHGQGPCINPVFHKCMADITAEEVLMEVESL